MANSEATYEVLNSNVVILASIECCKKLVTFCDGDDESLSEMLNGFEPNDWFNRPADILDILTQYLLLVHNLDWYAEDWADKNICLSGLRPDPSSVSVTGVEGYRALLEQEYIRKQNSRTELFMLAGHQVFHSHLNHMLQMFRVLTQTSIT